MKTIRLKTSSYYQIRWLIRIQIRRLIQERNKTNDESIQRVIAGYEALLEEFDPVQEG